jgi:hypothetical protein
MRSYWIPRLCGFAVILGLGLLCGAEQAHATTILGANRVLSRSTHAEAPTSIVGSSGTTCGLIVGSSDFRGSFTAQGNTDPTHTYGCTITFNTAFSSPPVCVASEQSTINGYVSVGTPTTTTLHIGWQTATAAGSPRTFYYSCMP